MSLPMRGALCGRGVCRVCVMGLTTPSRRRAPSPGPRFDTVDVGVVTDALVLACAVVVPLAGCATA